jgi:hypothetical protein
MPSRTGFALLATLIGLGIAMPAESQEVETSVLSRDEVRGLVNDRSASVEADRSALRSFLMRPEVSRVAGAAGIDIARAQSAAATLSDEEIRRLAPRVKKAENALAGGESLVISSTVVIIGLLVLILILVA